MRKRLRHQIKFAAFLLATSLAKVLTRRISCAITTTIIKADRFIVPKRARILRTNIAAVFPNLSTTERDALVDKARRNVALLAGEFLHLQDIRQHPERISIVGGEHVEAARGANNDKAIIFVSGHFSNWELMAQGVSEFNIPISVMYRPEKNETIAEYMRAQRDFANTSVVHKGGGGTREIINNLKEGTSIALLCDQRGGDIEVDFLGHKSRTTTTPAKLARRFEVAIVPSVIRREEQAGDPSHFVQHFFPPIYVAKSDNADADIKNAMDAIYSQYAEWVYARPEEWYWYHNRWKLV